MTNLKRRLDSLPEPQPTRYTAMVYDEIDMPAKLTIIHPDQDNEQMTFRDEKELDDYCRREGISDSDVFKIRRVIAKHNDLPNTQY